jgi:parvin
MSSVSESASFLSNTLKRRQQKRQEVTKILQEGISSLHVSSDVHDKKQSLNEGIYPLLNIDPDSYLLDEGDERSMLEPSSSHDPAFKQTIHILLNWLNTSLSKDGILLRALEEDLYDGYILAKLIELYQSDVRLLCDDVPLSQESKKKTLRSVLHYLDTCFQRYNQPIRWTFEQIFNRDFIAILHLLLALMKLWNVKMRLNLPKTLQLKVIVVKKRNGILHTSIVNERFIDEQEQESYLVGIHNQCDVDDFKYIVKQMN